MEHCFGIMIWSFLSTSSLSGVISPLKVKYGLALCDTCCFHLATLDVLVWWIVATSHLYWCSALFSRSHLAMLISATVRPTTSASSKLVGVIFVECTLDRVSTKYILLPCICVIYRSSFKRRILMCCMCDMYNGFSNIETKGLWAVCTVIICPYT